MERENIEDKQASPESVVGLFKKNNNGHLRLKQAWAQQKISLNIKYRMKSYKHSTGGFKPPEVDLHIHKLYLLSRKECNHILPPQMAINGNHPTFPPLYGYILNVVAMITWFQMADIIYS